MVKLPSESTENKKTTADADLSLKSMAAPV